MIRWKGSFLFIVGAALLTGCPHTDHQRDTAPWAEMFSESAQVLSSARSKVHLGARIVDGIAIDPGVGEEGLEPWEEGLDSFTRIARRKSSGGIEGTVKSLRGVALGVGGQAAWGVSVTGVKIRRLKSLEVIGKATGDYVLQAWYVTDATLLLGDHYWTDLDLKTQDKLKEKIGQLGLKLSDDRQWIKSTLVADDLKVGNGHL